MLNLKKISQAMLIAVFACTFSFCVNAADERMAPLEKISFGNSKPGLATKNNQQQVDSNYENAKTSKKAGQANAAADSAATVSKNTYQQSTADMKARSADAENAAKAKTAASKAYDDYTKSDDYKKAKEEHDRLASEHFFNIEKAKSDLNKHVNEVTNTETAKVNKAKSDYNNCLERGGKCSDLLLNVQTAEKARDAAIQQAKEDPALKQAISDAYEGTDEFNAASKKLIEMDEKATELKQNLKTAEKNENEANAQKKAAQQAGIDAAMASISAQDQKIAQAKQDKAKAERERDKAAADVEKKCGKNSNSQACAKAKERMDKASAQVALANKSINDANDSKAAARQNIADLTAEDRQKAEEARIAAEEEAAVAEADAEAAQQIEAIRKRLEYEDAAEAEKKAREDAKDAASTANNKYNGAVDDYKKAADNLAKLQAKCQKAPSDECKTQLEDAQKSLSDAKTAADQAYRDKDAADKKLKDLGPDPESLEAKKAEVVTASQNISKAKQSLSELESQHAQAKAACEYSKKLTSKQGKAEAQKHCEAAEKLAADIEATESQLLYWMDKEDQAKAALSAAGDHSNQEYMAFEGDNSGVNYTNTKDVLQTITRRAAYILVGLKPIVYTFAGFGLIAFAYMAIFNKISWKWFGNIAIGLFLVANMGRLIEYAVFPTDDDGKINDGKLDSFGDYLQNALNDTEYVWVDPITPYTPPTILEKQGADKPDETVEAKEEKPDNPLRKFCGKTDGATGWGNFSNCVKDVVSAGKKAVAAAQKVQNTVNTVTNAVNGSMNAVTNIVGAAKSIGKGNLEDSVRALGRIGQNVNSIVGITGGAVGQIMNNATGIRNDMQDVTKSIDEQRELQARRDRGEATNKFNAKYMGQVLDENGEVERLFGGVDKDGNVIAGDIASNRGYGIMRDHNGNIITKKNDKGEDEVVYGFKTPNQPGFMDGIQNVVKTSNDINNQYQNAVNVTSDAIGVIGNARIGAMHGLNGQKFYDGSQTINDHYTKKQQEKQQEKQAQQSAVKDLVASIADSGMTVTDVTKQAAQDAVDYNKLKSEALSAASTAKSLNNAAKKALSEAQKSGDADAIKKAKEFLSTQQDAYVSVAKAYYKASEAHATLVEDVDSRKTADNAYAEVARQALAQQETEDARRNYMENTTPDKIAQAAKEQLNKAQNEAAKAAAYAKEREQVAKKAADLAKNAAEKAKDSGNPADLAKAEELQKRADLAKAEADSANVAAAEAQKPIADLQQKSKDAQVKKLEVDQKKHKQAIETAETEMKNVRSKIADAQAKAKTLLDQVEKLAQAAEKDPNNDDAVMAASQAYKVYQSAQQEINKLQKELDETIRQKSAAENSYFSTISQLENLTK